MRLSRITPALAASAAALLVLAGCSDSSTDEAEDQAGATTVAETTSETVVEELPLKYVALGDSYASMATAGNIDLSSPFCLRSVDNYASQLAGLLGTDVTDVSCQGGVVSDVTAPRATRDGELPPQLDALDESTTLVTLTMGGNDIGFGKLASCAGNPATCTDSLLRDTEASLGELPAHLDQMYAAIAEKAPNARVITTGYLPLIATGDQCFFLNRIPEQIRGYFVETTTAINSVVEEAAVRNGAAFVLPANTDQHTACAAADQRWTDFTGGETNSYAMHPTVAGQTAMANAIAEVVNQ